MEAGSLRAPGGAAIVPSSPAEPAPIAIASASDPVWSALARPEAYPRDPSARAGVEWIQTHLSHVYRTGERVYKFRKPVAFGFVDFSARGERSADCVREVALNRRLAPDVYLGVAALRGSQERPEIGAVHEPPLAGEEAALEHCVVMRRLADGRDALSLLQAGALRGEAIDALAARVASFHAEHGLGTPAPFSPEAWRARCTGPVEDNFALLAAEPGAAATIGPLRERARAVAAASGERFERRRREGRAVDGHGDLHLQHVWFETPDAAPLVIDCLEFSEKLRCLDAAAEVAFAAMDLRYRGRADLAERFLRGYARESDDFDLYSVVDYFVSYRAAVRAKVAALAARDAAVAPAQRERAAESVRAHLRLALDALAPPARRPALVLVAGVAGTGKSSVAAALAEVLPGVVVASDRVRKRLLGVAPTVRVGAGWRGGGYTEEWTLRTYAGLLERARGALGSGRSVLLDATFSSRARRAEAARFAAESGAEAFLVEVRCAPEIVRERLARRAAEGRDPSDAGPAEHDASARAFEETSEWDAARRLELHTDRDDWRAALGGVAQRIRGAA